MSDRVTGVEARELLAGATSPFPWSVDVFEETDFGTRRSYLMAYVLDGDTREMGLSYEEVRFYPGDARILAAAPRLAETVAWLCGREADKCHYHHGGTVRIWRTASGRVEMDTAKAFPITVVHDDDTLTEYEARELARALLAAANEAEGVGQ